jgi:hypothetical protein
MAVRMRGSLHESGQPGCARIFEFTPFKEWTILQAEKQEARLKPS